MTHSHFSSGGRYPVLRSIAIMYLLGGCLAGILGIIGVAWLLAAERFSPLDSVILAAAMLAVTFFVVLSMLAIAEVLKLFIDIEHNSRAGHMEIPPVEGNGRHSRLQWLDGEETAEGALLRGH